jgi:hypothetical protein
MFDMHDELFCVLQGTSTTPKRCIRAHGFGESFRNTRVISQWGQWVMPLRGECVSESVHDEQPFASWPFPAALAATMRARHASKIQQLQIALEAAGFRVLDEQANALGLSRSTTWTIVAGKHKSSGLSATIINRMLTNPSLHPLVRATVLEYAREKATGQYGHTKVQLRRFSARLRAEAVA